ncbi:MAG: hypothetical protein MI865_03115 [Proteobacteria bacterium]|nr:hypothetical protein [Pseudomonadota bacterium]
MGSYNIQEPACSGSLSVKQIIIQDDLAVNLVDGHDSRGIMLFPEAGLI